MWEFIKATFGLITVLFLMFYLLLVISRPAKIQSEVENVETTQDSIYVYKLEPARYGLDTLCIYADHYEPLQMNRVFLGKEETIETEYIVFIKDNKVQSCVSKYDYIIK